jgi:uncharacterized protein (DUF983 family)
MTVRIDAGDTEATVALWSTGPAWMAGTGATAGRRFRPCPSCGSRKRALYEAGGRLHGHCLRCGAELEEPLASASVPLD